MSKCKIPSIDQHEVNSGLPRRENPAFFADIQHGELDALLSRHAPHRARNRGIGNTQQESPTGISRAFPCGVTNIARETSACPRSSPADLTHIQTARLVNTNRNGSPVSTYHCRRNRHGFSRWVWVCSWKFSTYSLPDIRAIFFACDGYSLLSRLASAFIYRI